MMLSFDSSRDVPDLTGKAVLVTGGTAGLGRATITVLAAHGASHIIFTGRNEDSARETIKATKDVAPKSNIDFVKCDMTDLSAVKAASSKIASSTDRLDLVFCNAGVMATAVGLSKDGFENQFAINHLGHAMLVRELLPVLQKTAASPGSDVRVIFSTSLGYHFASQIDYDSIRTKQEMMVLGAFRRYGQSKLANILYPAELARKFSAITFVSIHPGVIKTGLITGLSYFNRIFTELSTYGQQVSPEEGVKNQLWAATAAKPDVVNGAFYEPVGKPGSMSPAGKSEEKASELYKWTEGVLSNY